MAVAMAAPTEEQWGRRHQRHQQQHQYYPQNGEATRQHKHLKIPEVRVDEVGVPPQGDSEDFSHRQGARPCLW